MPFWWSCLLKTCSISHTQEGSRNCSTSIHLAKIRIYWAQFAIVVQMHFPKCRTVMPVAVVSILYLLISDSQCGFLLSQIEKVNAFYLTTSWDTAHLHIIWKCFLNAQVIFLLLIYCFFLSFTSTSIFCQVVVLQKIHCCIYFSPLGPYLEMYVYILIVLSHLPSPSLIEESGKLEVEEKFLSLELIVALTMSVLKFLIIFNIVHTHWGFSCQCHVTLGETQLMGINTSGSFLMGKWIRYR